MLQFTGRICLFLVPRLSTTEYKLYPTLVTNRLTDSPITIHDEPGAWPPRTSRRVTACLQFMESALTTQWDFHFPASEQETISANLGIYGYIMAKYLRNMALKCYLGGLFPTFLAFSVNRCVIFPSPPLSHLGLGWAWV